VKLLIVRFSPASRYFRPQAKNGHVNVTWKRFRLGERKGLEKRTSLSAVCLFRLANCCRNDRLVYSVFRFWLPWQHKEYCAKYMRTWRDQGISDEIRNYFKLHINYIVLLIIAVWIKKNFGTKITFFIWNFVEGLLKWNLHISILFWLP
jgi:hypothetical protein